MLADITQFDFKIYGEIFYCYQSIFVQKTILLLSGGDWYKINDNMKNNDVKNDIKESPSH